MRRCIQIATKERFMAVEQTLSIIKPDAVERNLVGKIIARFEEEGLRPVAMRRSLLSLAEAKGFYAEHDGKPFFDELVNFMTRSPVLLMVLEGDDAIVRNRQIMGATNPAQADAGTLRQLYADSIGENTVHGSDSPTSAAREVNWFFKGCEVVS
jgi:nucleoside-diphosphate kinase